MENERIIRIREKAASELEKKVNFWEDLRHKGQLFRPMFHQANPIYESINNGAKRILLAGTTGSGKTLPLSMIVSLLNKKKPQKTLWIAPDQALRTALNRDVNRYIADFGLPPLKIASVSDPKSVQRDADILAINYCKLGYLPLNDNHFVDYLLKLAPSFGIIVLDECHNLKNPDSQRNENFERFINKTMDKYFFLASASPCHNRLKDLGSIFHLLEPTNYPLEEYEYNRNPNAIMDFIARGKWFNFTNEDLRAISPNLPPVPTEENGLISELNVEIPDEYVDRYIELWADRFAGFGQKLMGLRKILLEGMLAKDDKDCWLRDLLSDSKKDGQTAIFSYLKEGITDKLVRKAEQVIGEGKVGYVDGKIPFEKRVEIADLFSQGKLGVNVYTTKTMSEGIPSLTYERPIKLIHLEPPINQGDFKQCEGRVYRIGQTGSVSICLTLGSSKKIEEAQEEIKLKLENEECMKSRSDWTPGTIHGDINNLRKAKAETYEKLMTGQKRILNSVEERIMNASVNPFSVQLDENTVTCLASLIHVKSGDNTKLRILDALNRCHGMGKKELQKAVNGKGDYAKYYQEIINNLHLIRSASYSAALVGETVRELERKGQNLESIVDFGCGPVANIARNLNRPITNLDASKKMLERAKKVCEKYKIECKYVKSFMQTTPFKDSSMDTIISSNSLNFNRNIESEREVEDVLLESNRILRKEGYFIVTFPKGRSVSEKEFEKLTKLTEKYGFSPIVSDTFKGLDKDGEPVFTGTYMLVAKKGENKNEYSPFDDYRIFLPQKYVMSGGEKLSRLSGDLYRLFRQKSEEVGKTPLYYVTSKGQSLKDVLK